MGREPDGQSHQPVQEGGGDGVDDIGVRHFPEVRQARPGLHAHDQHEDRQQAVEQRRIEALDHRVGPGEGAERQAHQQRRDRRAAEGIGENVAHHVAVGAARRACAERHGRGAAA